MNLYQLTLLFVRETELKTLPFCPICQRLNVARNQLRNWTVGGRNFEEMLRELVS